MFRLPVSIVYHPNRYGLEIPIDSYVLWCKRGPDAYTGGFGGARRQCLVGYVVLG